MLSQNPKREGRKQKNKAFWYVARMCLLWRMRAFCLLLLPAIIIKIDAILMMLGAQMNSLFFVVKGESMYG